MIDAIDGLIIMTPDIVNSIDAIFDARVPHFWMFDPTGGEISWMIPNLGKWYADFRDRCD
jgi:dynein heavy chain